MSYIGFSRKETSSLLDLHAGGLLQNALGIDIWGRLKKQDPAEGHGELSRSCTVATEVFKNLLVMLELRWPFIFEQVEERE